MVVLKHVDVMSAAKIAAVVNLILGLIVTVLGFIALVGVDLVFGLSGRVIGIFAIVLIIIPLLLFAAGFIFVAIEAWLYNVLAQKFGGVKLEFKKNRLVNIDPTTAAKLAAMAGVIIGFIAGLIFGIGAAARGSFLGLALIIVLPIAFALIGFIAAAISVVVYNFLAVKIGGIGLNFKGSELKSIDIISFAKIEAVISAIWGLVQGVFIALRAIHPMIYSAAGNAELQRLGVAAIIVVPILYFITSFIGAAIEAWIYNWLVPKVGGVKLIFSKK